MAVSVENPMNVIERFRRQFRRTRRALGLSQRDIGRRLKVAQTTIAHFETGQSMPRRDLFDALVEELERMEAELAEA